jgi:hypothetical protein
MSRVDTRVWNLISMSLSATYIHTYIRKRVWLSNYLHKYTAPVATKTKASSSVINISSKTRTRATAKKSGLSSCMFVCCLGFWLPACIFCSLWRCGPRWSPGFLGRTGEPALGYGSLPWVRNHQNALPSTLGWLDWSGQRRGTE